MDLLTFGEDSDDLSLRNRPPDSMQVEDSQKLLQSRAMRYAKPGRAVQACRKCRNLKMRCVVSPGSSTCNRCCRLGRTCEFQEDDRQRPLPSCQRGQFSTRTESSKANARSPGRASQPQNRQISLVAMQGARSRALISSIPSDRSQEGLEVVSSTTRHEEPPRSESIDLLSIYSMSPVAAVVDNGVSHGMESPAESRTPATPAFESPQLGLARKNDQQPHSGTESPLSLDETRQLIYVFKERLLNFIPVFGKEDFEARTLYESHRDLAHCICYVTSFFLPGGMSIANALRSHVTEFVLEKCTGAAGSQNSSLSDLHAMMILYAYSRPSPNVPGIRHPISASLLKTMVEGYAVTLGLHRSVEGVKAALRSNRHDVTTTSDFKKYTYWLWLYTLAHHVAVLNRTPPSLRADASIRNADKLLADVDKHPRISRILGEVELCLLWEKASTLDCRLSEWWCVPETVENSEFSPFAALKLAEDELRSWCNRWSRFIVRGGYGQGLDFHYRYARFCISSYALQFIKGRPGYLTREESASIESCMQYALDILDWALCLSPVSKDALRYMSDFGFVLITFAALFVTEVCQHMQSIYDDSESALNRVATLSDLMVDLAISTSHFTAQLGRSLQRRVARSRQSSSKVRTEGILDLSTGDGTMAVPQIPDSAAELGTAPVQLEGNVCMNEFHDGLMEWDPTAWWDEFLSDAGEWNFS